MKKVKQEMINIALEFNDTGLEGIDLSRPERGNPGIGGSLWMFLMLARYLKRLYGEKYRITVYHYNENIFPKDILNVIVKSEKELIEKAEERGEHILVHQINQGEEWYKEIEKTSICDIPWAHCYIRYPEIRYINRCKQVKRVVFVGREEYDSYIDDDIIEKIKW